MISERNHMIAKLLDRIMQDAAAVRMLIAEPVAVPEPEAEILTEIRARATDLGLALDAAGRVSLADAARLADRSERTIARWREAGALPATTVRRRPRFRLADLAAALAGDPDIS